MSRIESTILRNLIYTEEYTRKVLPFIQPEYFSNQAEKYIFNEVKNFVETYKVLPTYEALIINFNNTTGISEDTLKNIYNNLKDFESTKNEPIRIDWLVEQSEKFCQDKAVYNAIMESVSILDTKDGVVGKGQIPQLLADALSVSFDTNIGHDYINDAEDRYDFYHKKEKKLKFDLDFFNKITKGGLPTKTLNIALAGTGVGKSLFMCHVAASCVSQGKNVLYITMEMSEEKIAERIDANLLNVTIDELHSLSKDVYTRKFSALKTKTQGKLIIKEYPTASAHSGHFRALLNELKIKRGIKPDIIFVDYLNICCSSRIKMGSSVNSYVYIKAIAEELRGLAVEFDVPIVSATQTTRSGFGNTEVELTDTSESFGLPATADFMFALIASEELDQLNQIMVKQLKNRYGDPSLNKKFVVGIDRAKMRLYDAEMSAQDNLYDTGQIEQEQTSFNTSKKFNSKFDGVKV